METLDKFEFKNEPKEFEEGEENIEDEYATENERSFGKINVKEELEKEAKNNAVEVPIETEQINLEVKGEEPFVFMGLYVDGVDNGEPSDNISTSSLDLAKISDDVLIKEGHWKKFKATNYKSINHIKTLSHQEYEVLESKDSAEKSKKTNLDLLLQKNVLPFYDSKQFRCEKCGNKFKLKQHLQCHMLSHTNQKPFICKICLKPFKSEEYLKNHMVCHAEDRPFSCQICQKSFKGRMHLRSHMFCHSDKTPFTCDICQKSFKGKQYLKQHMFSHSDEKPFTCETCERSFKEKRSLQRHFITHSDVKPFSCEICKGTFKWKVSLDNHINSCRLKNSSLKSGIELL